MDGNQLVNRTEMFFRALPNAGFSQATFRELGEAARAKLPFSALSKELKLVLFNVVREYHDSFEAADVSEAVTMTPLPDEQLKDAAPAEEAAPTETIPAEVSAPVVEKHEAPEMENGTR